MQQTSASPRVPLSVANNVTVFQIQKPGLIIPSHEIRFAKDKTSKNPPLSIRHPVVVRKLSIQDENLKPQKLPQISYARSSNVVFANFLRTQANQTIVPRDVKSTQEKLHHITPTGHHLNAPTLLPTSTTQTSVIQEEVGESSSGLHYDANVLVVKQPCFNFSQKGHEDKIVLEARAQANDIIQQVTVDGCDNSIPCNRAMPLVPANNECSIDSDLSDDDFVTPKNQHEKMQPQDPETSPPNDIKSARKKPNCPDNSIPCKRAKPLVLANNECSSGLDSDLSDDDFVTPKKQQKKCNLKALQQVHQMSLSQQERNRIAESLPSLFEYVIISADEKLNLEHHFKVILRLNIRNGKEAEMWLEEYEMLSSCDFRIRDMKKENTDRLVWKKIYRCHHSIPQSNGRQRSSKRATKNTNCSAVIRITINQSSMKWSSDDLLVKYPCIIQINHYHNHPIMAKEALRHRRPSKATEKKFRGLFAKQHSPSSAVEAHKMDLQEEYGTEYFVVSADRSKCPDVKWASRLYYKIFKKVYGPPHGAEMLISLEQYIVEYNKLQGSTCAAVHTLNEKDIVVALCTPLMKRVHEKLRSAGEIMFMDSSGTMDILNTRVFLLMCPSIAGALPIGILLTSSESEEVIKAGLDLLMSLLPEEKDKVFGGRGKIGPKLIMTDDSTPERNALHRSFPLAILLLCIFHVLSAFWKYVWDSDHKVDKCDKSDVYFAFREIVYSSDEESYETAWNNMLEMNAVKTNKYLMKHLLQDLKPRETEWALHLRKDLLTRGHNTNNLSEAGMKILKEKACCRRKSFSPVQLLDVMVTRFNNYVETRIIDIINSRSLNIHRSRYFIDPEKLKSLECVKVLGRPNMYLVKNVKKGTDYVVNMLDEICSCPQGCNGAPCKHQCVVAKQFDVRTTQILNIDDPKMKKDLFYVVYGTSSKLPPDWFASLQPLENSAAATSTVEVEHAEEIDALHPQEDAVHDSASSLSPSNADVGSSSKQGAYDVEGISTDLKMMYDNWIERLQTKPDVYAQALSAMIKQNDILSNSDSALTSAMHTFGKEHKMRGVTGLKIRVNSISVGRRTAHLGGGRNPTITGRPSKAMLRKGGDHTFSSNIPGKTRPAFWHSVPRQRGVAPHSLSTCTERSIPLGRTHQRK